MRGLPARNTPMRRNTRVARGRLGGVAGIGQFGAWRHTVVGGTIAAGSALAFAGVIGTPTYPENFDARQVVVAAAGADALRIRSVVDQDFGSNDRHGYERRHRQRLRVPTESRPSSPDAPADVHVDQTIGSQGGPATRIRLGDPDVEVTGQHRYVLSYTLPDARLDTGRLDLDVVNPGGDPETGQFEVVVTGMTLADPGCAVGAAGGRGRHVHAGPDRATRTGRRSPRSPPATGSRSAARSPPSAPPPTCRCRRCPSGATSQHGPARRRDDPARARRRRRRVRVLPPARPQRGLRGRRRRRRVRPAGRPTPARRCRRRAVRRCRRASSPDSQMAALATTEFVPPTGIAPWQGNVLLRERIDDGTVSRLVLRAGGARRPHDQQATTTTRSSSPRARRSPARHRRTRAILAVAVRRRRRRRAGRLRQGLRHSVARGPRRDPALDRRVRLLEAAPPGVGRRLRRPGDPAPC